LQDVVNQRRMIDESPAGEEFKQVMRGKLDALLALAEATGCRRERLLAYFGEDMAGASDAIDSEAAGAVPASAGGQFGSENAVPRYRPGFCGNCDNCLQPPEVWDATDCARKLLSTIYRVQQQSGIGFGAGHVMDILRGKATDKVQQFGHERISTFGLGAEFSEVQLRGVLRQLIAVGAVSVDAERFNTLRLEDAARAILKGGQPVRLRAATAAAPAPRGSRERQRKARAGATPPAVAELDAAAQARFAALKAWRAEVAREHNLPAYVIFHDATLAAVAARAPRTLDDLHGVSGIGAAKLDKYGQEVLRVCGSESARG
ncbi:RQC domain-containing protein, partial [Ottowia sp.]|uniref:RecQ family ATP-dependent DNA helicase n=1 Tax=Ottowia sp. TaxID=1898956 RepID=UPI0039E2C3BB